VVSIFLITNKKGKKVSNNLLAVFLIAKTICYAGGIMLFDRYFTENLSFFFILSASADLILGPSLYLYAVSLMYRNFKLKKLYLLHLIPFIVFNILCAILVLAFPGNGFNLPFSKHPIVVILNSVTYIHFLIYSILCLVKLKGYEQKLKSEVSSIERIKLSWLFFLIFGFTAIWVAGLTDYMVEVFEAKTIVSWDIFITFVFIFANIIVFKGLKQPELFAGINENCEKSPVQKYAKTALPNEKRTEMLEQITDYMKINKPYLNPSITLDEFSGLVCIPAYYISQILNTNLNQNFYDFINSYRIEESKISLKTNPDHTILQVLYDTGFNSKASFNRAFKKFTGMTPSEYKKMYCTA
jgi:AraC-like DNA-binding protein